MSDAAMAEATEATETTETTAPETQAQETSETKAPAKAPAAKTAASKPAEQEENKEGTKQEYWPDDWRERVAEHYSAGDKKAYDRELKRLQRFRDPAGVYGMGRELEAKFSEGGLAKIPGKDASEEEVAAFWKQLGVPEKADDYLENLELANGATLGEYDIPVAKEFAEYMHKANATPQQMSAAINWYYQHLEKEQAQLEEMDDKTYQGANDTLKEKYGASLSRQMNALPAMFAELPGGADATNPESVWSRLIGGRTSDGVLIGNDPDILDALISWNRQLNPVATVTDYGSAGSSQSIEEELAEIRDMMRKDRRAYNKNTAIQSRYRELLEAQSARASR